MLRTTAVLVCALVSAPLFAAAPQVIVIDAPRGMGQESGGSLATDSFMLANAGPGDASITVSQNGNFFTVSPTAFTLAEGATRTVTIRSSTQANGVSDGSLTIFTAGSPRPISFGIRLFVASRPAGTVTPIPSAATAVGGLPTEQHAGQLSISNRGSVGMQGILVSDVPWILPQASVIGIPANGRTGGIFLVDPAKRPDGESALGAITGTLGYVYLNGTSNTSTNEATVSASPASSRVSVSVTDITKPPAAPGQPPPLAPNEIALFLAGLSGKGGATTDLFVSNRTTTSIPNVKLYYTSAGSAPAAALLASVPQLSANINAFFPGAPQLIFNAFNQTGTLQVRNAAALNVSLTSILSISGDLITTYRTALPVLRSDRGAVSRVFAGVEKSATRSTNISVQETSGNAATVTVDFFDANGSAVGAPRTESLPAFGFLQLQDVVPSGALAAQVTAGGAGKIAGYATVVDQATLDSWIITDPASSPGGTAQEVMVVPLPNVTSSATVELFVTGTASVNLNTGRRRHAVRPHASSGSETAITTAAGSTQRITYAPGASGYVLISGATGNFTSSARVTLKKANGSTFGGAIPVRRALDGASAGSSRRVSGIDDPLSGPHPSLTLIESGGSPASVRVSGRFTFNAGVTVTGQIAASKDFSLNGGQILTINDVVGAIVGAGRGTLGDLSRIVIDVEVTGGNGRVLPFVQSLDAASGDVTIISD